MKVRMIVLVSLLLTLFEGFNLESDAQNFSGFQIIANKSNPVTTISKSQLSRLFLKKEKKWETDKEVLPVDLKENFKTRAAFSKAIHGRPVSAIKAYWQKMIFSGRQVPPPEKGNDQDVINFVERYAGAVGYVSPKASISRVKKIKVVD